MVITRVSVQFSRKMGLPNYSSVDAQCGITIDLTEDETKDIDATMRNAWKMVKANVAAALKRDLNAEGVSKPGYTDKERQHLGWPTDAPDGSGSEGSGN